MWPKNLDSTPCCSPGASTIATTAVSFKAHANENFKVIQNRGFLPNHPQNWITSSLCHARHTLKISERSVYNFLSYFADSQTDRQTNKNRQKHYLFGGNNYYFMTYRCVLLSLNTVLYPPIIAVQSSATIETRLGSVYYTHVSRKTPSRRGSWHKYFYLSQGGNVFARLCLFLCLSVCLLAR